MSNRKNKKKSSDLLPENCQLEICGASGFGDLMAAAIDPTDNPHGYKIYVLENKKIKPALAEGDRFIARLSRKNDTWWAKPLARTMTAGVALEQIYGVIVEKNGLFYLRSAERNSRMDYLLDKLGSSRVGDFVKVALIGEKKFKQAKIIKNYGRFNIAKSTGLFILEKYKINDSFPDAVVKEASCCPEYHLQGREDLTALPLVTIDGDDSKDFDDAVYAEKTPGGFRLIVAIADVAYYVRPGSELDREAYRRGNSVYLPGMVIPMLPEALSNDLCSLRPKEKRPCLALFENCFPIPRGVSYNAYCLLDEKTVLFDTVDWSACRQLLENLAYVLDGRELDYLLVNHLEPDHAACIEEILLRHPKVKLISNEKAFMLMRQFGFHVDGHECIEVKEGDTFSFGKHTVTFVGAPMVHWPEAMVTLDVTDGVLFSADAFGTFGALDGKLFADEVDFERDWLDDARRYLTNIVGKYGPHIQLLLKKAGGVLDQIKYICPLHGPVWRKDLGWFIEKYDTWSRYAPETQGVLIVYASMYGNTENAAQALATSLCDKGMSKVAMYDVSSTHVSQLISEAFKYSHIVLASVTYNLGIYPAMHDFLMDMKALNLQNRTFAIIENGSWAVKSGDLMQKFVNNELKNMTVLNERLSLASSMGTDKRTELEALADAILESMK